MYAEIDIIKGCKKHQLKHQENLYRHFYSYGMSVSIRYCQNREDALEVLNDAFMKVFDKINQFDEDKSFRAWFRVIVVRTALDHYRANKKYKLHIALQESYPEKEEDIEIEGELEIEDILRLFDQLPDIQRIVFNLHKIEGYAHEEIAEMLGIAPGTSRSHLSRAISKLKLHFQTRKNGKKNEVI